MKKHIVPLVSSLLLVSQLSAANGIDERQQHQRERIANGIESGELTARETTRIVVNQAHIRATEARYKSDGHLTARERVSLHNKQNKASARIYRQKHDVQDRN